jgi:hypothetical protein
MAAVTFESVYSQAQTLTPSERAQLIGALANQLAQPAPARQQTQTERTAALNEICGKYAHVKTSVDEFLARKQEEIELEEARFLVRHPEEVEP